MKYITYSIVLALAVGMIWFQLRFTPKPLPVYKDAPEFTLTERSGAKLSKGDLTGKVWLAEFFYSTCPGPCPTISTNVASLQEKILKLSPDTRLVSISLDPEKDTPEVLRKYASHYEASPDRWLFLTGERTKVEEIVTKGFLISVARTGEGDQPIIHGTQLALVDRDGKIRGFYDGADAAKSEQIVADMRLLLKEKRGFFSR